MASSQDSIHHPTTPLGFCGRAWSSGVEGLRSLGKQETIELKNTTNSVVVVASFARGSNFRFHGSESLYIGLTKRWWYSRELGWWKKSIQLPRKVWPFFDFFGLKVPFIWTSSFGCSHVTSKFSCNISKGHLNFSILNQSLANEIRDKTTPFGGQRKPLPACMGAGGR